jgi:putative transposase
MNSARSRYHGHRFPPEIIGYAVWVYHRFCLSFRDVEDLLAERGIIVSYEAIRRCRKFGPDYARRLKKKQGRLGDTWHLDELFVRINGRQQYLWRAVDQDGDVIDIRLQSPRDQRAAERFLRRLLRGQGKHVKGGVKRDHWGGEKVDHFLGEFGLWFEGFAGAAGA